MQWTLGRARAGRTAWLALTIVVGLAGAHSPCRSEPEAQPTGIPAPESGSAVPAPTGASPETDQKDAGAAPAGQPPASAEAGTPKDTPPRAGGARKEDQDVRIGRQAALEIEKQYKLVRDPKQVARLQRIGRDVAAVCDEPDYRFTFKILDTEEVNALSLPGGFTYFTKAMMTYVRSDDELAGVMAHEIAHAAHHHVRDLIKREESANKYVILGVLGAVLLGQAGTDTLGNMLFSAEVLKTAYLNQYGEEAELDADRTGVEYVIKTRKYNPVGALTLIERLARDEARQAGPAPGIFRTHPPGEKRAKALEGYIRAQGFPVERQAVQDRLRAVARDATAGDTQAGDVVLDETVLFQTAGGVAEAEKIAAHLNELMRNDLQIRQVSVAADGVTVMVAGEALLTVTDGDAGLKGKPAPEVAAESARTLARILWRIHLDRVS